MTISVADRVRETTTTTGTGTMNLAGAVTQFIPFAQAFVTGQQTYYCVLSGNGLDWEVGQGTFTTGSPNTLSRDVVLASSNSGALINLSGTSIIFCDGPAAFMNPLVQIGIPALYLAATSLFGGI